MEKVLSIGSLLNNEFSESFFEKEDLIESFYSHMFNSHMISYIAMNSFFVSFKVSGGS